ncbi:UDP-glucose--hexose-1-phosphate uridylyltransferase [Eggerthella sinensis]|uniref:UDP-glucose--hexose-1-phosphate uridylyltransferase n=1 Tax=Eggerthella sinensis TaxID=242230 RepID=UPI00248D907D|nr:UDP-glucose--hexose-1-phosphate uridylyltransferase [Eggerthella sinensis]
MGAPLPPPDEVRAAFSRLFASDPEQATSYLYDLGLSSGYLKTEDVARTVRWTGASRFGTLECTINLAKPEKDPRAIAAAAAPARADAPTGVCVPQCDLCWENEGFPGTPEHPAKPGLRIAAIELGGERWGLQFSPYAYFAEHCIALSETHRPMRIDTACFERLLDFADAFPHYFIGSNADLPIVGGSILSHDHFQGGRHVFPLMKAPLAREFALGGEPAVRCGIVTWPSSTVRIASSDRRALMRAAVRLLDVWRGFDDEACGIVSATEGVPHNTLNPIVRKVDGTFVMDLVLRNNRTDARHPWGIFHPDEELHHIKKENIGLIEIMGLAILPPRLAAELPAVQRALVDAARAGGSAHRLEKRLRAESLTAPHAAWALDVFARRAPELAAAPPPRETSAPLLHPVLQDEVTRIFAAVLEATAVFKPTQAGRDGRERFVEMLG